MEEHINKQINSILGLAKYLEDKANTLRMEYSVNGVVIETVMADLVKTKEFSRNIFDRMLQENQTILDKLKELEVKRKESNNKEEIVEKVKTEESLEPDSSKSEDLEIKTEIEEFDEFDDDEEL